MRRRRPDGREVNVRLQVTLNLSQMRREGVQGAAEAFHVNANAATEGGGVMATTTSCTDTEGSGGVAAAAPCTTTISIPSSYPSVHLLPSTAPQRHPRPQEAVRQEVNAPPTGYIAGAEGVHEEGGGGWQGALR